MEACYTDGAKNEEAFSTPKPEVRGTRFGFFSGLILPFYFTCGAYDLANQQTKRLSNRLQAGQKTKSTFSTPPI
ncbi:hypothetical protein LNA01_15920 [Companilactobacillus nantensis]|nr:hypothetical protein LNA01_15920 [Companilactobacillus nantensis]